MMFHRLLYVLSDGSEDCKVGLDDKLDSVRGFELRNVSLCYTCDNVMICCYGIDANSNLIKCIEKRIRLLRYRLLIFCANGQFFGLDGRI